MRFKVLVYNISNAWIFSDRNLNEEGYKVPIDL